ncbi:MAG: hypothetical protein MJE68_28645 [Proteobacteria bacterium]|nr:hypothetical protein [Pseudomonadota bacterium]
MIFDLLSTLPSETTPTSAAPTCPHAGAGGSGLCVSEDERGVVSVKGLSLRLATSEEDALNMLFEVKIQLFFGILKFMQGQILPIIMISYNSGKFRGRKLSRIGRKGAFCGEIFMGC